MEKAAITAAFFIGLASASRDKAVRHHRRKFTLLRRGVFGQSWPPNVKPVR